jgi:hypothetical protein
MLAKSIALVRSAHVSKTTRIYCAGWAALGTLSIVDNVLARACGLSFNDPDYRIILLLSISLLASEIFGRNRRVGGMIRYLSLWLITFPVTCVLSYLLASLDYPTIDHQLDNFDKALGFDWLAWYNFINAHPAIQLALFIVYASVPLQIIFSIIYFSHREESNRCNELWWTAVISLLITIILSGILPAMGTFEYYGVADAAHGVHLQDLHGLRDGNLLGFSLSQLQGIITLPSYHTVLIILLTYIYRDHKGVLWIVLPLNLVQLIAIPSEGGHYIADMLAGGAVAVLSIWIVQHTGLDARESGHAAAR